MKLDEMKRRINRMAVKLLLPEYKKEQQVWKMIAGDNFLIYDKKGIIRETRYSEGKIVYRVSFRGADEHEWVEESHLLPN